MIGELALKAAPWLAGVALIATIVAVIYVQHSSIVRLRAEDAVLSAEFKNVVAVNRGDQGAITALEAGVGKYKAAAAAARAAQVKGAALIAAREREAAALALRVKALEGSDNALPSCDSLLAVDLAQVCPGHAAALRLFGGADGHLPGPDGRGAGAGGPGARSGPHR